MKRFRRIIPVLSILFLITSCGTSSSKTEEPSVKPIDSFLGIDLSEWESNPPVSVIFSRQYESVTETEVTETAVIAEIIQALSEITVGKEVLQSYTDSDDILYFTFADGPKTSIAFEHRNLSVKDTVYETFGAEKLFALEEDAFASIPEETPEPTAETNEDGIPLPKGDEPVLIDYSSSLGGPSDTAGYYRVTSDHGYSFDVPNQWYVTSDEFSDIHLSETIDRYYAPLLPFIRISKVSGRTDAHDAMYNEVMALYEEYGLEFYNIGDIAEIKLGGKTVYWQETQHPFMNGIVSHILYTFKEGSDIWLIDGYEAGGISKDLTDRIDQLVSSFKAAG